MKYLQSLSIAASVLSGALAADISDIDHIVYFMQENRAFDSYYATMAGVRGLKDPNVKTGSSGKPIWYQPAENSSTGYLLPWYLSENQDYADSNQCTLGGSNGWEANHQSWANGTIEGWVNYNTPYSWGHYERSDLPVHFNFSETWTIGDMYAEAVIGPTHPNRIVWNTGTINVPGTLPGNYEVEGGFSLDNYQGDGCEIAEETGTNYSCYPFKWKTAVEYLEDEGISWFVWQDANNFGTNVFEFFEQFIDGSSNSTLNQKGTAIHGLEGFFEAAANGTLPAVTYIFGPKQLSEHPPFQPKDGGWLQQKIIESVVNSPKYSKTALFITYDETGGYGDHVAPFVAPEGTAGEWITDPLDSSQPSVPWGPGFRVPFLAVSPWTRGGKVFTEAADHNSFLLFLEKWSLVRWGKKITIPYITDYRRNHMSDLSNVFDFENPDYSIPPLLNASYPVYDTSKVRYWMGTYECQDKWDSRLPPVPYGEQNETEVFKTEEGHKQIIGKLTEGRYLVIKDKTTGHCVVGNNHNCFAKQLSSCDEGLRGHHQRFYVKQVGDTFSTKFNIVFPQGDFTDNNVYDIEYVSGKGYTIKRDNSFLNFLESLLPNFHQNPTYYDIYSVTYNDN